MFPNYNNSRKEVIENAAAISIQSLWRGFRERRKFSEIELEFEEIVQEIESKALPNFDSIIEWKNLPNFDTNSLSLRLPRIMHAKKLDNISKKNQNNSRLAAKDKSDASQNQYDASMPQFKSRLKNVSLINTNNLFNKKKKNEDPSKSKTESSKLSNKKQSLQKLKYIIPPIAKKIDITDKIQNENESLNKESLNESPLTKESNKQTSPIQSYSNTTLHKEIKSTDIIQTNKSSEIQFDDMIVNNFEINNREVSIEDKEIKDKNEIESPTTSELQISPMSASSPLSPKIDTYSPVIQSPLVTHQSIQISTDSSIGKPPRISSPLLPLSNKTSDQLQSSTEIQMNTEDWIHIQPTKSQTPVQFKKVLKKSISSLYESDTSDESDEDIRLSTVDALKSRPTTLEDFLRMSTNSQSTNEDKLAHQVELLITEAALKKRKKILRAKARLQVDTS